MLTSRILYFCSLLLASIDGTVAVSRGHGDKSGAKRNAGLGRIKGLDLNLPPPDHFHVTTEVQGRNAYPSPNLNQHKPKEPKPSPLNIREEIDLNRDIFAYPLPPRSSTSDDEASSTVTRKEKQAIQIQTHDRSDSEATLSDDARANDQRTREADMVDASASSLADGQHHHHQVEKEPRSPVREPTLNPPRLESSVCAASLMSQNKMRDLDEAVHCEEPATLARTPHEQGERGIEAQQQQSNEVESAQQAQAKRDKGKAPMNMSCDHDGSDDEQVLQESSEADDNATVSRKRRRRGEEREEVIVRSSRRASNSDWSLRRLRQLPTRTEHEGLEALLDGRKVRTLKGVRNKKDVMSGIKEAQQLMKRVEDYMQDPLADEEKKRLLRYQLDEIRQRSDTMIEHVRKGKEKERRKKAGEPEPCPSAKNHPWEYWVPFLHDSGLRPQRGSNPSPSINRKYTWRAPQTMKERQLAKEVFHSKSDRERRRRFAVPALREYRAALRKLVGCYFVDVPTPANAFEGHLAREAAKKLKAEIIEILQRRGEGYFEPYQLESFDAFLSLCETGHEHYKGKAARRTKVRRKKRDETGKW